MALAEIRVLVVDDSAVIRSLIADSIAATPGMKVVGTAEDGQKALEILDAARPDVITLDVQMPRMDGLATLDAILARSPIPVIMVSSLTRLGAEIALDALDRGAVDYLAKPDYGEETRTALRDDLPRKIRMAAGCDVQRIVEIRRGQKQRIAERMAQRAGRAPAAKPAAGRRRPADQPGRASLSFPAGVGRKMRCDRHFHGRSTRAGPVVCGHSAAHAADRRGAAHAPELHETPGLATGFSQRVIDQRGCRGRFWTPNQVLIAPGGKHLEVRRVGNSVKAVIRDGPVVSGHKPSVDVMMHSVVEAFGGSCLGVIMTGMGRDGADGCRAIRAAGGYRARPGPGHVGRLRHEQGGLRGGQRRSPVRPQRRRHGHRPLRAAAERRSASAAHDK